jgi:NAD(P)-dependent dehydrogenase (short-subunit alcohol dehydrogenase family)
MDEMQTSLAGKVALVTGASSGLGLRFAQVLSGAGAQVAMLARRPDRLEAAADTLREAGGTVVTLVADIGKVEEVRAAARSAAQALGPVSILVNNAGISRQARLIDVEEADYDAVMDTNLKGAFFMAQAVARQMIDAGIEGRIVNIASIAALRTLGQVASYCMSKAAMVQMTHVMAREWGRRGINTNAICPGYVATELSGSFLASEAGQRMVASLPRRRLGEPGDLDGLLLLLCSGQASRFINGAIIAADDGYTSS